MTQEAAVLTARPVSKGSYVATNLSNNLQVGYDTFEVRETASGVTVNSKHVLFGGVLPVQEAHFELDADWTPRCVEVTVQDCSTTVEFGDTASDINIRTPQGERRITVPVARYRAYTMVNGGLYFPMHIVRRFDFDNPAPQLFDLVPSGVIEVRRIEDLVENDERFRQLEMRCLIEGTEDFVRLLVNQQGDLVLYQTRNQNLVIKLEAGE